MAICAIVRLCSPLGATNRDRFGDERETVLLDYSETAFDNFLQIERMSRAGAGRLSFNKDEAWRIAANIAKLPRLLSAKRPLAPSASCASRADLSRQYLKRRAAVRRKWSWICEAAVLDAVAPNVHFGLEAMAIYRSEVSGEGEDRSRACPGDAVIGSQVNGDCVCSHSAGF